MATVFETIARHVQRLANIITIAVTASASVISSLDASLSEISPTSPSRSSLRDAPLLPSDNHSFFFLLRKKDLSE